MPEDAETSMHDLYCAVASTSVGMVEWRGYTSEPIAFGLSRLLTVFQPRDGMVDEAEVLREIDQLSMVQSVQVQTWRMVEDVCPFEICWIHDKLPALPAPHDVRCGIVSTFRDAPCLGSWLRYNLSVGIDKIYLYIDSPQHDETAAREAAGAHPGKVQLILSDAALRAAWESQVGWMRYGKYVDDTGDHSAVMARQSLNAEHAMRLAEADGLAWLAHIDVDELLHPLEGPSGGSVKGIFQAAEAAGAYGLSFPNHEVFPEGEGPYPDPFQSHCIFKLNEMIHPPGLPKGESRFLAYGNGKSAAKVGCGARPDGVHKWIVPVSKVALVDPNSVCLLHYVNSCYEAFSRKYEILGDFKDEYFGQSIEKSLPFHLAARNAAREGHGAMRKLYQERVMVQPQERDRLLDAGHLTRITAVAAALGDSAAGE